jgi:hypothetical protein
LTGIPGLKGKNRWRCCDASYSWCVAQARGSAMKEHETAGRRAINEEDRLIPLQFKDSIMST